ncbi:unnamed protein product, partial [Didymodactylos carnosus]
SSQIQSIDIGNDGCAFIEIFVARSISPDTWELLLPTTLLMSVSDSKINQNRNQVKMLTKQDLNKNTVDEKWDRVKLVCQQNFNKKITYGLKFIKFSSAPSTDSTTKSITGKLILTDDDDDEDETKKEQQKIGSYFAKLKNADKQPQIDTTTKASEIRSLSNIADKRLTEKSMTDQDIQKLLKDDEKKMTTSAKTTSSPMGTPSDNTTKRKLSDDDIKNNRGANATTSEVKRPKTSSNISKTINDTTNVEKSTATFSQLMKDVTFVLSGFQNPLRADLRDKATQMGAKYQQDWNEKCSHLICAFSNTPKYDQVKKAGGKIVTKDWILDCHKKHELLSWKNYELATTSASPAADKHNKRNTTTATNEKKAATTSQRSSVTKKHGFDDSDDTDDQDWGKEVVRKSRSPKKVSKDVERKSTQVQKAADNDDDDEAYGYETDEDESKTDENSDMDIDGKRSRGGGDVGFKLTDCFLGKHFFAIGDFDEKTHHSIKRIIHAYGGKLEPYMNKHVKYVITNKKWNQEFDT